MSSKRSVRRLKAELKQLRVQCALWKMAYEDVVARCALLEEQVDDQLNELNKQDDDLADCAGRVEELQARLHELTEPDEYC